MKNLFYKIAFLFTGDITFLTGKMASDVSKSFDDVIDKAKDHSKRCQEAISKKKKRQEKMNDKIQQEQLLCDELTKSAIKSNKFAENLGKLMQ